MKKIKPEYIFAISMLIGALMLFGSLVLDYRVIESVSGTVLLTSGALFVASHIYSHHAKCSYKVKLRFASVLSFFVGISLIMSNAFADTSTATFSPCFSITAESSGQVTISTTATGWEIKAYGIEENCEDSTTNVTFTINNTGTKADGTTRSVNFKITTTGMTSNDTSTSKTLDATATSLIYAAQSGQGTEKYTTITISFSDIEQEPLGDTIVTTIRPGTGGMVQVDGDAVNTEHSFSNTDDHTYTLVATAADGYSFFGWMSSNGALDTTGDTEYEYLGQQENTIWPLFYKTGEAMYCIKNATPVLYYASLNDAITAAGSSGVIVAYQSGIVPEGDYTIPVGVTLLIPYDEANTVITNNMADYLLESNANKEEYRKLTLASGANISVLGTLCIGSQTYRQMTGQSGPYGAIAMDSGSTVTILSGANLYAWGYITGSGSVTVRDGGTVFEQLCVTDYPGSAKNTLKLYNEDEGQYIASGGGAFPLREFSIRNVAVSMTFEYGATEKVFYSLWGSTAGYHNGYTDLIGSTTSAFAQLSENTTLEKSYVSGIQKMKLNGSASINALKVSVSGLAEVSSSKTSGLPIPSYFEITICSGTTTLNQSIILSKGSKFTVEQNATLDTNGNNLYVFAAAEDKYSNSFTTDAVLDVNGTINSSGGFYTSKSGAAITSSAGTGKIVITGSSDKTSVFAKSTNNARTTVAVTAAQLLNGNNTYLKTATTGTVTYTYIDGYWHKGEDHSDATGDGDHKCDYCPEDSITECTPGAAATCTTNQECTECGKVFVAALGHTPVTDAAVAPICTTTGLTEGSHCGTCGEVLVAQEVVAALGHSYGDGVETPGSCTEAGKITYTCQNDKSHTFTKTTGTQHVDSNGDCVCDSCELYLFYATNVNLGNNLDMLFAIPVALLNKGSEDTLNYVAKFTQGNTIVEVPFKQWTTATIIIGENEGVKCYVITYTGFAAKDMCEHVTLTIYNGDTAVSESKTDSIQDYAMRLLEKNSKNDAMRTLLVDMLNYGAACKQYLALKENSSAYIDPITLANYELTATQKDWATKSVTLKDNSNFDEANGYRNGSNLVTTSSIDFAVAFNGSNASYFICTYQNHWGTEQEYKVEISSDAAYYKIPGIVVADAWQEITVTVYDASNNVLGTWTDSIESYCARMGTDDVFTAFMKFSVSAKAYLESKEAT